MLTQDDLKTAASQLKALSRLAQEKARILSKVKAGDNIQAAILLNEVAAVKREADIIFADFSEAIAT